VDERAGFPVLPIVVFPFFHMLNLDVHHEAFGHKLNLLAEAFDQYTGVAFDFIKALVMLVESSRNAIKPLIECLKPPIEILNEFLVHAAPSASEG
jgi:hypothetical protein